MYIRFHVSMSAQRRATAAAWLSKQKSSCFFCFFCDTQHGGVPVNKDCCAELLWQGLTESDSKWVWRTERSPARSETVPHFCNLRECPLLQLVNTRKNKKTWPTCSSRRSTDSSCWCELALAEWAAKKNRTKKKTREHKKTELLKCMSFLPV